MRQTFVRPLALRPWRAVALAIGLALLACQPSPQPAQAPKAAEPAKPAGPPAAVPAPVTKSAEQPKPAALAEPLKVGTILSTSGPPAYLGDKMKKGLELAIEELNAAGGIGGRKIEWFFYDAAFDSAQAVNQTRRLLTQDKVDVIVGGGSASGIALAMAPVAEEAGVVFMATEGARQIVEPVDKRRYVFKATFNDTEIVERTIQFWKKKGITKVAFLPDTSGFGQSALEVLKELAPKHGIELFVETFDPAVQDMTPQLTRLAARNPQTYLAWTATPAGVIFLKNAKQLNVGDKALIQHGFGFVDDRFMKQAGDAAVGSLLTSPKLPVYDQLPDADPVKARATKFADAYKRKFNEEPNVYAGQTYDGMYLVAEAVRRAGTAKSDALRQELEKLVDFVGVTGVHTFSAQKHAGLQTHDAVIIRWNGTRFELADYEPRPMR
jgi:branched-chain amino acid transport system substrate-binding protein